MPDSISLVGYIVYPALCLRAQLRAFYPGMKNPLTEHLLSILFYLTHQSDTRM